MNSIPVDGAHPTFEVRQLLEGLTASQLRDALFASHGGAAKVSKARQKSDLIHSIETSSDREHIVRNAHRIEALTPFKHLFLFKLINPSGAAGQQFVTALERQHEQAFKAFCPLKTLDGSYQMEIILHDAERQRSIIKFAHAVDSVDLVTEDDQVFRKVKLKKRHPLVLTLRFAENLATVSFPGYSQGNAIARQERIPYEKTVAEFVKFVSEWNPGIVLEDLALKSPIEYLLKVYPTEIANVGRDAKKGGHGLSVHAGDQHTDVFQALMAMFPGLTKEMASEGLEKAEAPGMLLLWKKYGVVTRVNLREASPDILFIWKGTGASSSSIDAVVETLREGIEAAGRPQVLQANEAIRSLSPGEIVQSSWLSQHFSIRQNESARILIAGMTSGLLQIRFRVRSNQKILHFNNPWRQRIDDLPSDVTDEHGNAIDIRDPDNVEVGYERVVNP